MNSVFMRLAGKSILHRKETVFLAVFSMALSVFLLLSVERFRQSAEEGFTQTLSQTDLIVGARTGPTNLVLATVFNRGQFANNIQMATYEAWRDHRSVEWTIPLALGDGHRGYRVVGTTKAFYQHYHYQGTQSLQLREGQWADDPQKIVIGAEVARALQYQLGNKVIIDHGVTHEVGLIHHDDHPFFVGGILQPTGTIIDQSLFLSLEGLSALHAESPHEENAHEESSDEVNNPHEESPGNSAHHELTAFFLKLKNRVDILNLQRAINNDTREPLSAVIPSVVITDLWQMLANVEKALRVLGWCILAVSLLSMIGILMATLNERRKEMAILRALGAGPRRLAGLLVWESAIITLGAVIIGVSLQILVLGALQNWLRDKYGLFITPFGMTQREIFVLGLMVILGTLVGLIPAFRIYRSSLKDGLSIK